MTPSRPIRQWLVRLAGETLDGVFNPWASRNDDDLPSDGPAARLQRLERHLDNPEARYLLVGEAPGHLGARISGIAFSSEKLIYEGAIPRLDDWYQARISTRSRPFSEPSATIVWRTAFELGIADQLVLWNAFPWHPYGDSTHSNRTPTDAELDKGLSFLEELIAFYEDITVVAVGKKSLRNLQAIDIYCLEVRHPSMGGASAFAAGMRNIIAGR